MLWTPEKIAALSPDPATLDRAQALATTRKWRELGGDAGACWGECRSSGAQYYRTAVDLTSAAFYCSCPSRRLPCKHVLSLLLLQLGRPDAFRPSAEAPSWVVGWRHRRDHPADADAERRRLEQRERTRDQRLDSMQAGAADLEQWLLDLVRQGLAAAANQPDDFWEAMAARMVDARLGSIGRRVRQWKSLRHADNWPDRMLGELGELFLLARSLQRLDDLPAGLRQEALTAAGLITKREAVLQQPPVRDYWLIAGLTQGVDENLRYRRTWLLGARSPHPALLLDFAWGEADFEENWQVGAAIRADLAFYPGNYPLRAVVKQHEPATDPFTPPDGFADLDAFADAAATALAANPWMLSFPALLEALVPVVREGDLLLVDRRQRQLAAGPAGPAAWQLLALGGGRPLTLFGEWNGRGFAPLSAFAGSRLVELRQTPPAPPKPAEGEQAY